MSFSDAEGGLSSDARFTRISATMKDISSRAERNICILVF